MHYARPKTRAQKHCPRPGGCVRLDRLKISAKSNRDYFITRGSSDYLRPAPKAARRAFDGHHISRQKFEFWKISTADFEIKLPLENSNFAHGDSYPNLGKDVNFLSFCSNRVFLEWPALLHVFRQDAGKSNVRRPECRISNSNFLTEIWFQNRQLKIFKIQIFGGKYDGHQKLVKLLSVLVSDSPNSL